MNKNKKWSFVHHEERGAKWAGGLRNIFEYRDLGIKNATNGDYVAHVIRRNKNEYDDSGISIENIPIITYCANKKCINFN